jgi:cell division protein FtsL
MAGKLLEHERKAMKTVFIADLLGFWFWSLVQLLLIVSSAFGRTIRWRGVRYRLISPSETIIEEQQQHQPK